MLDFNFFKDYFCKNTTWYYWWETKNSPQLCSLDIIVFVPKTSTQLCSKFISYCPARQSIPMSEKLSPLNDVCSVIFSSSGLSLNKDNAHCFKTNSANPITLSVCQIISCSLDACDLPWCTRYCPYLRLMLYVSTVFFAHVGTLVQRRSCLLLSAKQTFWIKARKSCPSGGQVTWDFNLQDCKVIRHKQVDGRLFLTLLIIIRFAVELMVLLVSYCEPSSPLPSNKWINWISEK